jgi:hypothetical protein
MVVGATLVMALMHAMYGHPVDALVDMVGGSKSGTDEMTACAGLDQRD